MNLTDQEKRMLDGSLGKAKQKAIELIVRFANVLGAEALYRVTWADLFCGSHVYLDVVASNDFDELFSRMSLCSPEKTILAEWTQSASAIQGLRRTAPKFPNTC